MEKQATLEPERTKVAVSNAGCALVVTTRTLPAGEDLQEALERLLSEQIAQANIRLLIKNIGKDRSHVEGEFPVGTRLIHSDQYGYLTSEREFYSLVFASEQKSFASACKPVIEQTVKSVTVK
jgi:hypothetical protein